MKSAIVPLRAFYGVFALESMSSQEAEAPVLLPVCCFLLAKSQVQQIFSVASFSGNTQQYLGCMDVCVEV